MAKKALTDTDVRKVTVALARLYRASAPTFEGGQQVAAEAVNRVEPLLGRVNPSGKVHYWLSQAAGSATRFERNPLRPPKADLALVFAALAQARRALQAEAAQWAALAAWSAEHAPVTFTGTVYDYNRAGVVAFRAEQADVTRWRALADDRRRVRVTVEVL